MLLHGIAIGCKITHWDPGLQQLNQDDCSLKCHLKTFYEPKLQCPFSLLMQLLITEFVAAFVQKHPFSIGNHAL